MITLVSANEQVRDELQDLVRSRLNQGVRLLKLDYQSAEWKRRLWPFT